DGDKISVYRGKLNIPSQTHGVRVWLEESFTGNISGTLDIPGLEIRNVPLDSIAFNADNVSQKKSLFLASERLQLSYVGAITEDVTAPGIYGKWVDYPGKSDVSSSPAQTDLLHRPIRDSFVSLPSSSHPGSVSPEKAGFSAEKLRELKQTVQADANSTIDAMLVYRKGNLLFEQYYNGYSGNSLHKLSGVSRSITALLTGIALRDNLLEDLHEPISSYLNVPKDSEQAAITLHHLMTMSSGLACNDWSRTAFSNRTKMLREKDWVGYYWRVIMADQPGTGWSECGGNGVLMAAVLEKVSGMRFRNYLSRNLLEPLGIAEFLIEHDAFGDADGGSGISLSAYDLAKIGQLLLDNGSLKNEAEPDAELIPAQWLETVWKEQFDLGDEAQSSYGYFWWTKAMPFKEGSVKVHYAAGMGGQYLMIIPELDIVCVFLATDELNKRLGKPFELLQNYILPAVVE
ncbi:MAG: serine hydrolase, partial [Calditrichota bacterium]